VNALNRRAETTQTNLEEARNDTATLDRRLLILAEKVDTGAGKADETFTQISRAYERQRDLTKALRTDADRLNERTTELTANLTRMLVFAAENKAEILELRVANSGFEGRLDRLNDAHTQTATDVDETSTNHGKNLTRLDRRADAAEKDLRQLVDRFRSLESLFSNFAQSSGELRTEVASLRANHDNTKDGLETVK